MTIPLRLATMALRAFPRVVSPDDESHAAFFELSHLNRLTRDRVESAMHAAAHDRHMAEVTDRFLEKFFSLSVEEYLRGKRVLDFGCYCGGTAIAWEKMYGTKHMSGFDISPVFIEGANLYAKRVGYNADFSKDTARMRRSRTAHLTRSLPSMFSNMFTTWKNAFKNVGGCWFQTDISLQFFQRTIIHTRII